MRVWVVEVGEPLPIDPGPPRLMRAGLLCEQLAALGHEAVWFTSAFNHYRKVMRPTGTFDVACKGGAYQVVTLKALGYEQHISVRRLRDHRATARDLLANADRFPRPDVICAGLPTLDLADASARLADRYSVPCVVDIQDLWPDIFVERLPRLARPFAAPLLFPMERMARRACGRATGVEPAELVRARRRVVGKHFGVVPAVVAAVDHAAAANHLGGVAAGHRGAAQLSGHCLCLSGRLPLL